MLAALACGSFSADESTTATDAGGETRLDAPSAPGDGGGSADGPDGGCTVLVEDAFDDATASAARWRFLGSAKVINGELELVPNQASLTGAIWMNVADPRPGTLRVRFTSKIAPAGGADGLTFAWTANQDVQLGGNGGSYGLCGGGAEGLAFALAGNVGTLKLIDVSNVCTEDGGGLPTNVFGTNGVEVSAFADRVEALVADKRYVFTSPRTVVVRSFGFTAATGGGHARHAIDSVRVERCPP
jgi:hypothetical protein